GPRLRGHRHDDSAVGPGREPPRPGTVTRAENIASPHSPLGRGPGVRGGAGGRLPLRPQPLSPAGRGEPEGTAQPYSTYRRVNGSGRMSGSTWRASASLFIWLYNPITASTSPYASASSPSFCAAAVWLLMQYLHELVTDTASATI